MQHPIQETQQLSISFFMKNNNTLPSMGIVPFLSLIFTFSFYPEIAQGSKLSQTTNNLQTYIVYVKRPESTVFSQSEDLESYYQSFFPVSTTSSNQQTRMVYSYRNVVTGFAARLTQEEVSAMEKKDGFVSARPERILHVQTTHTPDFLGLHQDMGFWKESNFGKGVIIGVLDSGVLPSHPSFSDEGIPPPPAKWKGKCEFNISDCNNKLIGARSFNLGAMAIKGEAVEPPLDDDGHGTHTAGTAAGNFVKYADVLGNAKGTAVGMAPYAHLAIYKVCFAEGCPDSDILAALDAAIEDGVDVLSLSIGASSVPFFQDTIAVGSFAAIQKGIFVSAAAGNSGPFSSTLSNEAPWILTVGASTTDRRIVATAKIGNGEEFDGESLYQPNDFPSTLLPLVYAGAYNPRSRFCAKGSLNGIFVKGKVVLCEQGGGISRIAKGVEVKNAGGAAMILMNDESSGFSTLADAHVLPATHVSYAAGLKIKTYIGSVATPTATVLFKGTVFRNQLSPAVASFSSRGPNLASPGIVKPDIIGPGVNILAAWPFTLDSNTNSKSTFNIISGTSMACPHLSGIAALLKSSHPYWSPASIKSAIMTSADLVNLEETPIVDETLQPADVFATGSGHVNPSKANDPGLIYDIQPDEYIPYLCGLGYSDSDVGIIAHKPIKCSEVASIPEGELNYPSFSVALGQTQTFTRTVTNVGEANSIYTVAIDVPQGVEISVNPSTLDFAMVNQKLTYSVTFSLAGFSDFKAGEFAQGAIHWISTKYSVKSPVSIKFE